MDLLILRTMKHYRIIISVLVVMLLSVAGLDAQIKSTRAKININNIPVKERAITEIKLHQPNLDETKVFVTPESSFDLAGEVDSDDLDYQVSINNAPPINRDGNFFWQKINLNPGSNNLSITISKDGKIEKEYYYKIFFTAPITNLAGGGIDPGKYYALIIGINSYPEMGENLDNAVRDATSVYEVLASRYLFEKENMNLMLNPKREDIYIAFDNLKSKIKETDNLLIFYAGHGLWEEDSNLGYWLPSDARRENRAAWFPNSSLVDYLKAIKSQHTLLISDACFAGSIFKTRNVMDDVPASIEEIYKIPSRKAITSGTLTEVPDQSIFIKYLLDRLENNTEKYLPSETLYSSLRLAVSNNSSTIPRTGVIQGVGDEGGDFIFILKQ